MSTKITLRRELRPLLVKLDDVIRKFDAQIEVLKNPDASQKEVVDAGAERQHLRTVIVGLAWQINKVSTGRTE